MLWGDGMWVTNSKTHNSIFKLFFDNVILFLTPDMKSCNKWTEAKASATSTHVTHGISWNPHLLRTSFSPPLTGSLTILPLFPHKLGFLRDDTGQLLSLWTPELVKPDGQSPKFENIRKLFPKHRFIFNQLYIKCLAVGINICPLLSVLGKWVGDKQMPWFSS